MQPIVVSAPSSKSLSHRALIASALSGGGRVECLLESDDIVRTREILTALGARFNPDGPGAFTVTGIGGAATIATSHDGPLSLFVGESGTTCRLMTAVVCAGNGSFRIHGAGRMHQRPIRQLIDALQKLGAQVAYEQQSGCPPLRITASGFKTNTLPVVDGLPWVSVNADESSQYISGLLLAAPVGLAHDAKGLILELGGGQVVSWPYISLTLDMMQTCGITVQARIKDQDGSWSDADWRSMAMSGQDPQPGGLRMIVRPGSYGGGLLRVEGDWSGASYLLAAGALGQRPVRVTNLSSASLQADAALVDILLAMGAHIQRHEDGLTVYPSALHGVDVDMGRCPDLAPTVAVLASRAQGETRILNAAHLAAKESDRLAAPAKELRKVGCEVAVLSDGLRITPPAEGLRPPAPEVLFSAHDDHRIAMSLSLLSLSGIGHTGIPATLDNPGCVAKSFPEFWDIWERIISV